MNAFSNMARLYVALIYSTAYNRYTQHQTQNTGFNGSLIDIGI